MAKRAEKSAADRPVFAKVAPSEDQDLEAAGLDDLIGYRLRLAYNLQVQRFVAVGGPHHIRPPQFAILKLAYHNRHLNQTDLTNTLKKKHANVVPLLDELEERNLISRLPDDQDKRTRLIALTPAGTTLTETLLHRHALLNRHLEQSLGRNKLRRLVELLDDFLKLDPDPDIDRND